ncbi:hypothetical protein L6452_15293 [Arctium lappa]|uniref:Uncharacterized protein n=1 Tax=Arctium lappa TaxID=4217 RepID=A0ACB9CNF3_ARCLA|nr:hypothetical protein L6452_15293 [Arctium lappa]
MKENKHHEVPDNVLRVLACRKPKKSNNNTCRRSPSTSSSPSTNSSPSTRHVLRKSGRGLRNQGKRKLGRKGSENTRYGKPGNTRSGKSGNIVSGVINEEKSRVFLIEESVGLRLPRFEDWVCSWFEG